MMCLTNRYRFVLCAVAMMIGLAAGAGAAGTNVIPFYDSFEAYTNDAVIIPGTNTTGQAYWDAPVSNYLVATSMSVSATSYPLNYNHTNGTVARVATDDGSVTCRVAQASYTNVYLDMNIQMLPWTSEELPAAATNDNEVQTAVFLSSNQMLTVYHSSLLDFSPTFGSNVFTELSHTAIETGSWHRLTLIMDYQTAVATYGLDIKFFQVKLDGTALTNANAWVDPSDPFNQNNGSWFVCPNQSSLNSYMSAFVMQGNAYLDDFVVTNAQSGAGAQNISVTASVTPADRGSVTPSDTTVAAGTDVLFTITPDSFFDIQEIRTNGVATGATTSPYTWTNAPDGGTLLVVLEAQTNTNYGVPLWWLDEQGLSTTGDAGATNNADGDAYSAWEEWILSTDPTTSNSFEVTVEVINGSNRVSWIVVDGSADNNLPDFKLLKGTNLTEGFSSTSTVPRAVGPVEWSEPASGNAFYQFRATD